MEAKPSATAEVADQPHREEALGELAEAVHRNQHEAGARERERRADEDDEAEVPLLLEREWRLAVALAGEAHQRLSLAGEAHQQLSLAGEAHQSRRSASHCRLRAGRDPEPL